MIFVCRLVIAASMIASCMTSAYAEQTSTISVRDLGSLMNLGKEVQLAGQSVTDVATAPNMKPFKNDPNGAFETGQMYVEYVKLQHPKFNVPVLMWHGGGLTGQTWETKPDGQPGWNTFFMRAGFDVYVSDAVERGKSTWSKYPEIYTSAPIFRSKKEAWELFRLGPTYGSGQDAVPYGDTQFPVDNFREFAAENTPRWLSNDAATQEAYDKEVQQLCPCVIIAHSQGTSFALRAAEHAPDKVRAVVLLEASSAPTLDGIDFSSLQRIPYLFLWGDHIKDSSLWVGFEKKSRAYYEALRKAGVKADWKSLPDDYHVYGNTHMIMMDRNSDEVASIVLDWLKRQHLNN